MFYSGLGWERLKKTTKTPVSMADIRGEISVWDLTNRKHKVCSFHRDVC
jgi:hypothetical protein